MQVSKVRQFILAGVYEIDGRAPEKFRELIQSDLRKYGELILICRLQHIVRRGKTYLGRMSARSNLLSG